MQQNKEQIKDIFQNVAKKYDEIKFFKISAREVAKIIQKENPKNKLDILDVACGTGNVVLECASHLKEASFDAVDISEGMLSLAKQNAKSRGLENINFILQDITEVTLEKNYDVINCSYILFFLPNAVKVLKALMKQLKPNGKLIFTSFLQKAFTPTTDIFLPLLAQYGSTSAKEYQPNKWQNLKQVADIERLCAEADITNYKINIKKIRYGLSKDAWWELLNNTGFSGMLRELSEEDYKRTKKELFEALEKYANKLGEIELNADSYFVVLSN